MAFESIFEDTLLKVAMFVLVQALVYAILSKSSNIFSKASPLRSLSFKSARSVSIRRIMAVLSDVPAGGEQSPKVLNSPTMARQPSTTQQHIELQVDIVGGIAVLWDGCEIQNVTRSCIA
ncbi:hypothetical protein LguiA_010614 [Lonicera macranthoides]